MIEGTDAQLMARSLEEPQAFGGLFDRHGPALLGYLVRRAGPDVAEGLLGETFRIAFERRESFDKQRDDARPWLYGIATRLLLRHRRDEDRRLRASARLRLEEGGGAGGEEKLLGALDARALLPRVADAIVALPDAERDALLLFAWEDQSYEAIAAALEVPVGTVRSRLNRARKRLRSLTPEPGGSPRRKRP
jgi:RNA polymerase sigma-70 factor (ECF subfamily)